MPFVPPSVPLIMGTADLADEARGIQRAGVWVMEPPIDTEHDHPGIDGAEFRREQGVAKDDLLVVCVSRLAVDLKLDALVRAIDAANALAGRFPLKLVLVGGGPAYSALYERAQNVNARWGRPVVVLAGPRSDPRAAYAAADLVVGMGSSALRALSIGRPVIVQGEEAFSLVFEPDTLNVFLRQGFYGLADGAPTAARLSAQIEDLLLSPERRSALGKFGREVVMQRFSLSRAVQLQLDIYREALTRRSSSNLVDATRAAYRALKLEVQNHDPRRKREQRAGEAALLTAARQGNWPPQSRAEVAAELA
jgi:glycosyltransferase involved in cell wall biosynthesis